MKKFVVALVAIFVTVGAMLPAYAYDGGHHQQCHKVKVHHHWEKRCH